MTIRTALLEVALPVRRREAVRRAGARASTSEVVAGHRRRIRRRQARRARGRAIAAPGSRAISSSPTSRTARAACAISTRCSGSRNTSTACATPRSWSSAACSTATSSSCSARCEDFLWSVRCHMHFVTGRAEERLSFDIQREIAVRLGYTEHPRPAGRRALHEALLPDRQGCRRPHRDRLRRAGGAPGQARAGARPRDGAASRRAGAAPLPESDDFVDRQQPHQRRRRRTSSSAIRST